MLYHIGLHCMLFLCVRRLRPISADTVYDEVQCEGTEGERTGTGLFIITFKPNFASGETKPILCVPASAEKSYHQPIQSVYKSIPNYSSYEIYNTTPSNDWSLKHSLCWPECKTYKKHLESLLYYATESSRSSCSLKSL